MVDFPATTNTFSSTGAVQGLTVELEAILPTFATDTFQTEAVLNTSPVTEDINIAIVIDTSGSTGGLSGSDVDGDGDIDTYLEAEIEAAKALFQSIQDAGFDTSEVEITLIEYNTNAATVGSYGLDEFDDFVSDVEDLDDGGRTNYEDGLQTVLDEWTATTTDGDPNNDVTADDTNYVFFLSDGRPFPSSQVFTDEVEDLEDDFNAQIIAIGVGDNAPLGALNQVDNTGGAQKVTDISQLSDVITGPVVPADFEGFEIVVDGEVLGTFPPGHPAVGSTPFGYTLDCVEITGYDYVVGEDIDVEIRAVFDDGNSVVSVGSITIPTLVCFAEGALILTPGGYVAVQDLAEGDRVITRDHGAQPIKWIGARRLDKQFLSTNPTMYPIRLTKGSLGGDLPESDLMVSRQHRFLMRGWQAELTFGASEGVFVPAHALVNDGTIRVNRDVDAVTYYHFAFENHEVVTANGVETESLYLDAQTISALGAEQRDELFRIFPELENGAIEPGDNNAARRQLKGFEGQVAAKLRA
ncbi:hypothetical protein ACMU_08690 [Actibacterium mucosum KCTC 23349]|uniref:VWFA domain-containing protein n=1 Tax=Actibacterium mucosum KCTC 23349 TaxID=1454373 RepID=A0A037ZHC1_9RHOB|nr:Hint domain-containing protein [Actibacterium mucosum]KAJ55840.1 hypothetical protein ACMU_08690 [Actibacterium mucosum KCTC 23349]